MQDSIKNTLENSIIYALARQLQTHITMANINDLKSMIIYIA